MPYRWDTAGEMLRRVRVGETISYGGGEVPESSLVRDCRKIAPKLEGGVLIQTLCDALEEKEREVERLRDALQGLYEAAHTTWMNDDIEMAVEEAGEALRVARERGQRE